MTANLEVAFSEVVTVRGDSKRPAGRRGGGVGWRPLPAIGREKARYTIADLVVGLPAPGVAWGGEGLNTYPTKDDVGILILEAT